LVQDTYWYGGGDRDAYESLLRLLFTPKVTNAGAREEV